MAVATKTLDRQLHKLLAKQSGQRIFAHAAFLVGHRYEMRDPKRAATLLSKTNRDDYFAHCIQRAIPHWFTVIKRVMVGHQPFWLVQLNAIPQKYWLISSSFNLPIGAQLRGWFDFRRHETRVITVHSLRVRLDSPVGTPRLVTSALQRVYPALRVVRVFRMPGSATFVAVHAQNARGRHQCYAPATRQYIQQLFYRQISSPAEVFRLVLADQPHSTQIAHLLGVRPDRVRSVDSGVYVVRASGHRVHTLAPLAAQFLGCTIRVRA